MHLTGRRMPTHLDTAMSVATATAVCLAASAGCAGHRVATTFAELESSMKPGRTVYVTGTNGILQEGSLERFGGGSAAVTVSGATVQVLERETARIAVPEPLWQGAVIGGATGALLGGLLKGRLKPTAARCPPRQSASRI